jgi:hypothetical protein
MVGAWWVAEQMILESVGLRIDHNYHELPQPQDQCHFRHQVGAVFSHGVLWVLAQQGKQDCMPWVQNWLVLQHFENGQHRCLLGLGRSVVR